MERTHVYEVEGIEEVGGVVVPDFGVCCQTWGGKRGQREKGGVVHLVVLYTELVDRTTPERRYEVVSGEC